MESNMKKRRSKRSKRGIVSREQRDNRLNRLSQPALVGPPPSSPSARTIDNAVLEAAFSMPVDQFH